MNLPVYKLVIDDNEELGVDFVALVDKPAIEKNWMAFDEVKQYVFVADKVKIDKASVSLIKFPAPLITSVCRV